MRIQLEVPDTIDFQLVYRMERNEPYSCSWEQGFEFVVLNAWTSAIRYRSALKSAFGMVGVAKCAAKLATHSRSLYLVVENGTAVSYGWVTIGRCNYYEIERDALVIGPIWTDPSVRGKGLASVALQAAINEYIRGSKSLFYIDTSKDNVPAQRVFKKCGFGEPVAAYFRDFR